MKNIIKAFKLLWCFLFNHKFYVVQEFGPHQRRIHCPRCGMDLAMNDNVRVVLPWCDEFENLYSRKFTGDPKLYVRIIEPWRTE